MANSYTKSLKLSFSLDQQNVNKVKDQIKEQLSNIKLQLSGKVPEGLGEKLSRVGATQQHVKDIEEAMKALKSAGIIGKLMSVGIGLTDRTYQISKFKESVDEAFKDVGEKIKDKLSKIWDSFIEDFKSAINNITEYISTQYSFSSASWATYQETGLSGADAYAYNMAKQRTGVSSLEDLSVWFSTTEGAQERWNELIDQYKAQYEQAQESAKLLEEFKEEYTDLKNEFITEILQWMSQNKETIKNVMKFALDVFKALASVIGGIVSFFGGEEEVTTSDIIKNYTNSSEVSTTNNNFGITVNGTDANNIATVVGDYIQTRLAIR